MVQNSHYGRVLDWVHVTVFRGEDQLFGIRAHFALSELYQCLVQPATLVNGVITFRCQCAQSFFDVIVRHIVHIGKNPISARPHSTPHVPTIWEVRAPLRLYFSL